MRCVHCGGNAGFLRRGHPECREAHDRSAREIAAVVADSKLSPARAKTKIDSAVRSGRLDGRALGRALRDGWTAHVKASLEDGGVDRAEEERLDSLLALFERDRSDVDRRSLWARVLETRRSAAERKVRAIVRKAVRAREESSGARPLDRFGAEIEAVAERNGIARESLRGAVAKGLEMEIERILDDGLLTEEEEKAVAAVAGHFGFRRGEGLGGGWERLTKAAVLRDLAEGKTPERMTVAGNLPFRAQKSETLLWVFQDVGYHTLHARTEYRGGYAGISVRVAKGLYFKTGSFRGEPVKTEEMVHVDTGTLGITTRHIYFSGDLKGFRIRHSRIVTLKPYTDGVGVMRDLVRAKPEVFQLEDGWFAYNLLRNVDAS